MNNNRIKNQFFEQDALIIAPQLLGKILIRKYPDNSIFRSKITEIEVYKGEEDLACHASKGKTNRTEIMYRQGGFVYVYLIYGMYWMLNFVTGKPEQPQAILIRAVENINGPGKLTKKLEIDKSFNGEDLYTSDRLWVENNNEKIKYITTPRIGVDYAGEKWKNINWRFVLKPV
ncbi:MAG: DNA-3-methyladenine glycosylase [Bacteroidales bacterium]|nr:DNA-3-methyladenine glycosylase [Bacteroidales bacterium]